MAEYVLGIDVGTTYTGAAIVKRAHASVFPLGNRSSVIPTVVLLDERGEAVTGEAANRRAMSAPGRVAREFKRRVGDTTPLLLGGVPMSPQTLMARMLESVIERVTAGEGGEPAHVAVSHPANWGPYKLDLLEQAVRIAGLDGATMISEPEAAAAYYASTERLDVGEVVAVYDLGGGTFDAAVVRRTELGFEILGTPDGIEHLGGIDIDEAVFGFVTRSLGETLAELDPEDPAVVVAAARLRRDCVDAKEALSVDDEVVIPVLLPGVHTEVMLTRDQLESFVRPMLADTMSALRRAVSSADISPDELAAVLLVGGSSRMPVVAEMVGDELGRPVAVDAHPKHSVALGTALTADRMHARLAGETEREVEVIPPRQTPLVDADETTDDAGGASDASEQSAFGTDAAIAAGAAAGVVAAAGTAVGGDATGATIGDVPTGPPDGAPGTGGGGDDRRTVVGGEPSGPSFGDQPEERSSRTPWYLGAAAVAAVLALIIGLVATSGGDGETAETVPPQTAAGTTPPASATPDSTSPDATVADSTVADTTVPETSTAPETTAAPGSTVPPDPSVEIAGLAVGRRFAIDGLSGTALDGDQIWVGSGSLGNVVRIDTDSGLGDVLPFLPEDGVGSLISLGDGTGTVWAAMRGRQEVAYVGTADTGYSTVPVSAPSSSLAWGGGALWSIGNSWVDRIDPTAGAVVASVEVPGAYAMAVLGSSAWVTQPEIGYVEQIDLGSTEVVGSYRIGSGSNGIATDGEALWISNYGDGTVARFDPASGTVTTVVETDDRPLDVRIDGDRVWVVHEGGSLVLIDRVIAEVVDRISVGSAALGIEAGNDQVWVADAEGVVEVRALDVGAEGRTMAAIVDVSVSDGRYVPTFSANFTPQIVGQYHVHLFWDTVRPGQAGAPGSGPWLVWDLPEVVDDPFFDVANRPAGATAICILVADTTHAIADVDGDGETDYDTGNCAWLPD